MHKYLKITLTGYIIRNEIVHDYKGNSVVCLNLNYWLSYH